MSQNSNHDIHAVLSRYWGYDSFRPAQEPIVRSVLAGRDTLGLLPTGGGKSITFQVPALMLPGVTVVVTPLISLMKDQVDNLRQHRIQAVSLHAGLTRREFDTVMTRLGTGRAKILYVSPERLQNERFIAEMRHIGVSLIVVDEAHCISQWGYDFRPSYLKISELRSLYPDATVLALTASATPEVVADIIRRLDFRILPGEKTDSHIYRLSFNRDNISYVVRHADYKPAMIAHILQSVPGPAIVYARSRRRTKELADELDRLGISALHYHAGLDPDIKSERQEKWKNGSTRVIVATNAFGMGIDKPDVRLVIHADLPPSLEEYYQEAGRAGRDGHPSYAVIVESQQDKASLTRRLSDSFPPRDFIRHVYEMLGNFLNIAVGDGAGQMYVFDFGLFCERFKLRPVMTENALRLLTASGYITYIEETDTASRVMITMNKHELYSLRVDTVTDTVLQSLLRTYTGLFADYECISESRIAAATTLTEQQVYDALLTLSRVRVLHYIPRRTTPYVMYVTSREEPRYILIPRTVYEERRDRMAARLDAMRRFVYDSTSCRVHTLLRYFGERPDKPCGHCDVCRSRAGGTDLRARAHADIEARRRLED